MADRNVKPRNPKKTAPAPGTATVDEDGRAESRQTKGLQLNRNESRQTKRIATNRNESRQTKGAMNRNESRQTKGLWQNRNEARSAI